jgi:hypothetical protein
MGGGTAHPRFCTYFSYSLFQVFGPMPTQPGKIGAFNVFVIVLTSILATNAYSHYPNVK